MHTYPPCLQPRVKRQRHIKLRPIRMAGPTSSASTSTIHSLLAPVQHRKAMAPPGLTSTAAQYSSAGPSDAHHGDQHAESNGTAGQKLGSWTADKENILLSPYEYLYGFPGKDIRSQLIHAFNAWLEVPPRSLEIITKVVGMLHTASLLIDDVEDSSILRRGVPVAHAIFGTAQTINSANYVYFLALQELQNLRNPAAIEIFTTELLNLHRGQGMDLYWRESLICPSEADYLEMVNNKTGGLFRLAVKLMQAESPHSRLDCVPLVNVVGELFQILDDLHNLKSSTYAAQKGLAEDLTEGKFSFPIIHAIRADPTNLVLLNVLKRRTTDEEVKRYAIAYMDDMGSFAYTRAVLRRLTREAELMVDAVDRDAGMASAGDGIRKILAKLRVTDEPTTSSNAVQKDATNGATLHDQEP